jgi:cysteine desulfurase
MEPLHFNHQLGTSPSLLQKRAMREAYLAFYAFAGAKKEDHFIFTSSGAEAVNHAVFAAYLDITRRTGKNHFLCSSLDEAPTIMAMGRLQELGCLFQMVPACGEGRITSKAVAEMITPRTAMLSVSWANGLTGVIQPLGEIAELCQQRGILFHVEATHVLGKGDFAFDECGADLLTFNGPYGGMGGMFIRAGLELAPLILGGGEQGQMRAGSFSVPALLECAKWAKEERSFSDHYCMEISRLRAIFEELVSVKKARAKILFQGQERIPHITSFLFPGVASDALFYALGQKGVHATFGGNHLQHFVHILKACGVKGSDSHCGLSFAFSPSITEAEIEKGAAIVVETAQQLQKYSEYMMHRVT